VSLAMASPAELAERIATGPRIQPGPPAQVAVAPIPVSLAPKNATLAGTSPEGAASDLDTDVR
jgi:hypothetical protein